VTERPKPGIQQNTSASSRQREQFTQAFMTALDAGPDSLALQVRYILALCQLKGLKPSTIAAPETPLTVMEARLEALVQTAGSLDMIERRTLLRDIQAIGEDDSRLEMTLMLMPHILTGITDVMLQDIYRDIINLPNPIARSRLLLQLAEIVPQITHDKQPVAATLAAVLRKARSIISTEARVRSFVALAPHLPEEAASTMFTGILDEIDAVRSDSQRANTLTTIAEQLPKHYHQRALESTRAIESPNDRARALTALTAVIDTPLRINAQTATLVAIGEIANEDERATALTSFAPNLEAANEEAGFPELLQRALSIAISLTRRATRARALVALAPLLTIDLQGEALAAVNTLTNERERAVLLSQLAPTLPPNMLVASLAVAHTMRSQDARVHALTVLAHHVPESARDQTMRDALAAATNLPHHYERVTALIDLINTLTPVLQEQAFTNALEATRLIDNDNAKARALSLLGHHLPATLIERALEIAYQIDDHQQQLNALIGITPHLPEDKRPPVLQKMLSNIRQIPFDYKRARALSSIASHLGPDQMTETQAIIDQLEDAFDQATACLALAQNTDDDAARQPLVERVWGLIDRIDDGYDRSSVLASIAPLIDDARRADLAARAQAVIEGMDDEYDCASVMTILAGLLIHGEQPTAMPTLDAKALTHKGIMTALDVPQQSHKAALIKQGCAAWVGLPADARYALWREVATALVRGPLADALLILGACQPIFTSFGDDTVQRDIAHILGLR
jgi:hypothetical protein